LKYCVQRKPQEKLLDQLVITEKISWMDLKNDYIGPEIDQVSISTHFFFIYLEGMTLSAGLPSMYFILFLHFFSIYWL
jgi:hypothetical protein